MHQALSKDKSLLEGVSRVNADRMAMELDPASSNTAAFCNARHELPAELPQQLFRELAAECDAEALQKIGSKGLWQGRKVKIVDGSTLLMPDTPKNQAEFPQMKNQEVGSGFPIARIVAIFSLLTGCALNLAIGPYKGKETGEHALLRQILNCFVRGEVALGDAYYSSYFLMATLLNMGVDFVFESHGSRISDFRKGSRLGKFDHMIRLKRPKQPDWMSDELYVSIPETMQIREVAVTIETSGFRPKKIVITTSFIDPKKQRKFDLGELYRRRWMVELYFRAIKTTMGMEMLRSKTPDMVRKEIWIHLLAYNAIRKIILDAAVKSGKLPNQISFKATIQTFNHYSTLWRIQEIDATKIYNHLLDAIIKHIVGNRPGRREPRKRKQRPKNFPLLHGSRHASKNKKKALRSREVTVKPLIIKDKTRLRA